MANEIYPVSWWGSPVENGWGGVYYSYANNFEDVVIPFGMNIPLPFTMETNGSSYRVSEDFDIKTRANITVNTTYYVDSVSGSDSNDGLTESTPLQTFTAANSKGDADRIYLKRGSYFYKNQRTRQILRPVEVIAYGEGDKPIITSDVSNQFGSFSQTSNYYSASASDFVSKVFDKSSLDLYGQPMVYTNAGSIANVDSTQGSYVWIGGVIYIRTFDDRTPDSSLIYLDNQCYGPTLDVSQYFEDIDFFGSVQMQNSSSAGGAKSYFLNCDLKYGEHQVFGQDESIFQNCNVESLTGDALNIDDRNSVSSNVYEVSSFFTNYKKGQTNSQGSTLHGLSSALSIDSTYTKTGGQCIGDTGTGQRYILGCSLGDSVAGVSLVTQNKCYIEGSNLHTDAISIEISSTGVVCYENNTLDGIVDSQGEYNPYLGSELVPNGNFSTNSDWILDTGWSIDQANNKATIDGSQTSTSSLQSGRVTGVQNELVKLSFEIKDYSAGAVSVTLQGTGALEFNSLAADGVYEAFATSSELSPRVAVNANSSFVGSVANVSIKKVC